MAQSYLSHLECSLCRKSFDAHQLQNVCTECGKPLLPCYDLDKLARRWNPGDLRDREPTMWRYRELLPIQDEKKIISLGETNTPLIHTKRLGEHLQLENLYVKDESRLPTGTFKSRGLVMAVSRAVELGVRRVAIPSAGNAAEALSVYAARAGLEAFVFMPQDAPLANQLICNAMGAKVFLVNGMISDAGKIVRQATETCGWFDLSTFREPYRVEGKKTMGLELAEQLGWRLPDVIIYPTGGGTGLVGMWKAFDELEQLGWIGKERPRMISVQSSGCAPIVRAFKAGAETAEFWENAETIAGGLRVPGPLADRLILSAIRESNGKAVAVPDSLIQAAMIQMSRSEGLMPSPEGAATLVAAQKLVQAGEIAAHEKVVLFNCGTMLKHLDLLQSKDFPILDPKSPIDYKNLTEN
jgi:threonine synthase